MIKILIVEDEALLALAMRKVLEENNYTISDIIYSGENVLSAISENEPDIILMDIKLKGKLDGIDIAKKIKNNYKCNVIYITGNFDEPTRNRALKTDPLALLEKPINYEKLFDIIDNVNQSM